GLLLHLRSVHPFLKLSDSSQVIIDNGLALSISPLPKLDKKMLHILLALCPTLLEILFVGVQTASFARAQNLRKAGSREIATNRITMQSHQRSNRNLTGSLFMQVHHFFIAIQTPRSSGLLADGRWCQWCRLQRKPFNWTIRRRCWLEETVLL